MKSFRPSSRLIQLIESHNLRIDHVALFKVVERLLSTKSKRWIEENSVVGKGTRLKIEAILDVEKINSLDELYPHGVPCLPETQISRGWKYEYSNFLGISDVEWSIDFLENYGVEPNRALIIMSEQEGIEKYSPEFLQLCLEVKLWGYETASENDILNISEKYKKDLNVTGFMSSEISLAIKYQSWRSEKHHSAYLKAVEKKSETFKNYDINLENDHENSGLEVTIQKQQTLLSDWSESDYTEWSDLQKKRYIELREIESRYTDSTEMTFWETIYEEDERYLGIDEEI
ncbi:MAG: hypothetical protein ACJ0BB_05100 [Dehalococcoidia bacterium]